MLIKWDITCTTDGGKVGFKIHVVILSRTFYNKENNVFKDGIGVHCNHGNHHGLVSRD